MRCKCPRVIVTIVALIVASVAPLARAQLIHAEAAGVVNNVIGSDLNLIGGANVGDAWKASYSFPATLSLASAGENWAIYQTTINAVATVHVGDFSATASSLTLKLTKNEPLALSDGTPAMADMIQLSGYAASSGVLIQTSWFYPVGTLQGLVPAIPTLVPSIIHFELVVLIDDASALVESHAELRSLEPPLIPVPEASTFGWFAAFSLCSLMVVRASRKPGPSTPAT
ncbi:MAG TPA: hypothetical protein VL069_00015 [Opitutus sp.]|nr:hypothetical protein [Opitutus sp.]